MKHQSRTIAAARRADPEGQRSSADRLPRAFLIKPQNTNSETCSDANALEADDHGAVVIAVVKDPAQLLCERGLTFHGDVVDLLTDLIVEAIEKDG
jgi:hypothetical protein